MRSTLARHQPREPASADELHEMNRRAWQAQGRFMVCPDEIPDQWLAQGLRNLADQLYGKRQEGRR